jgi:hypothetical protein
MLISLMAVTAGEMIFDDGNPFSVRTPPTLDRAKAGMAACGHPNRGA